MTKGVRFNMRSIGDATSRALKVSPLNAARLTRLGMLSISSASLTDHEAAAFTFGCCHLGVRAVRRHSAPAEVTFRGTVSVSERLTEVAVVSSAILALRSVTCAASESRDAFGPHHRLIVVLFYYCALYTMGQS